MSFKIGHLLRYRLGRPGQVGRILDSISTTHWHCLVLFGFRVFIAWPSRHPRSECRQP